MKEAGGVPEPESQRVVPLELVQAQRDYVGVLRKMNSEVPLLSEREIATQAVLSLHFEEDDEIGREAYRALLEKTRWELIKHGTENPTDEDCYKTVIAQFRSISGFFHPESDSHQT